MPSERDPQRFLIATATAHYKNEPNWDRPGLIEARQEIIELFTRQLGYQHVTDLGLDPTQSQLTERLREFCQSVHLHEDDMVAVYIACHGEVLDEEHGGGHVLLTHDTYPDDVADALPTEQLARKLLLGTRVRRLLLILDTCYSGQGNNELVSAALDRIQHPWSNTSGSGLVIVSSSQPMEQAETGLFPRLLREAVDDLATAGHVPATLTLDAVVSRMNQEVGHQRVGLTLAGLTGLVPPFLANPRHRPQLREVDLAMQRDLLWQEEADRRNTELHSRLLVRAQAHHGNGSGWWFTGRQSALQAVTEWLDHREEKLGEESVLAVTAGPGSGKTALLGLLAALAHPEVRRTVPVHSLGLPRGTESAASRIDVAIYAQTLTDQQVLSGIAAAARTQATNLGELLEALETRPEPLTVLIDGVDEAATPDSLCDTVLRPLFTHARGSIRLLLGTRPHLLPRLRLDRSRHLDLDAEGFADPDAILIYAAHNLVSALAGSPHQAAVPELVDEYARAVASAAGKSFLVARIAASTLAASAELPDPFDLAWRASLPSRADQAMAADLAKRLGSDAGRAVDLLIPLAYAEGQGLPWEDLWADVATATAISGGIYADWDLHWLRANAGSYIVEADEDGRSAYRLYHQALADHLRSLREDQVVHAAIARTLTSHVPLCADGSRNWAFAHPYTRRHLAFHAAQGGVLDEALADPDFLAHAEPDFLVPQLIYAEGPEARLAAAVYRASLDFHRHLQPDSRRFVLAVDAARFNDQGLREALTRRTPVGSWTPVWATGYAASPALLNVLSAHTCVTAIACTQVNSRPVAVTGCMDGTVEVWDLETGQRVGLPLAGHTGEVNAVACTFLDDRPAAVTGSGDGTVRIWDLETGQPIGAPITAHTDGIHAVACTFLDDRPAAVTGSGDGTVRTWDLETGQPARPPITGHTRAITSIHCALVNSRRVAVTGSGDGTVRIWDLETGQPIGAPITAHTDGIHAVACTFLDDRPAAVTGSGDGTVRTWDLETGQPARPPITAHTDAVMAIACTRLDDRPVAVTGSGIDTNVRVWDLEAGQTFGPPLTGHTDAVPAVACTQVRGRQVAVTGSIDTTVRIWDLETGQPARKPVTSHTNFVTTVACTSLNSQPVAVTGSRDSTLVIWDLKTGQPIGSPITGHTAFVKTVACTLLNDRPVAVSGSVDSTVRIWDLTTGQPLGSPITGHSHFVNGVACTVLNDRPVTVSGSADATVRIWDLETGQPLRAPITQGSSITTLACTILNDRPVAVTGATDGKVRIWDLDTGDPIGPPLAGHTGWVSAVACTILDDRPIAITGGRDRTVRIWDLSTGIADGDQPMTLHPNEVTAVTCTILGDRPTTITCSWDGTVEIWDLPSRRRTGLIPLRAAAVAAHDDRLIIASGSDIAVFARQAAQRRRPRP